MANRFPARLHVLLASQRPIGVVIRRGPAKSVCSILWNRANDKFELGQWMRGRIYERRCDVSPDGRHMIYFAMNGKWASETKGSWTAISRVPWLKAEVLLGKGDCWHGGGLFTSKNEYWVNDGYGHFTVRDSGVLKRDNKFQPVGAYGGECLSVYYPRLLRDGWIPVAELKNSKWDSCAVFEKQLPHGWILRKLAHAETGAPPGKGCYWDEHELENPKRGLRMAYPKWEWAELDGKTLVWAEDGCIYRARVHAKEIGEAKLLFDANEMKFEAIAAPY
jgi:hypothetical protein